MVAAGDDGSTQPLRPYVWVATLWLALAAAVAVRTLIAPNHHTVYPRFAAGAVHWWSAAPLYEPDPVLNTFRYPPAFALLMTPFAVLGDRAGGVLWAWLNIAVYAAGLWRVAREALPASWGARARGLFLALALLGAVRGIWNGQSNALVSGALLLALCEICRQRWWQAAVLLALTVHMKLSPLAPSLFLTAIAPRALAFRLLATLAVGAALPFLAAWPDYAAEQYRAWFQHLSATSAQRWPSFRDAWTIGEQVGVGWSLTTYRVIQVTSAVSVLAWCLWQSRRRHPQRRLLLLAYGMGCVWLMLFGPAIEFATYAILAPVGAWAVVESVDRKKLRSLALAAFLLTSVFGFGAIERSLARLFPPAVLALPLGSLLLAVWLWASAADPLNKASPEPTQRECPGTESPGGANRRVRQEPRGAAPRPRFRSTA